MSEQRVADPGPLGLAGFAMTTFMLSAANANLWKGASLTAAVGLALVYGGIAQFAAGMWEFARKNTFGALAFTSYGAFWVGFYAIVKFNLPGASSTNAVALYLLAWTIFTVYMTIAASQTNPVLFVLFVVLTATFVFLVIGNWGAGHTSIVKIGGWLGIITAVIAWYASFAGVLNETAGKTLLPLGSFKK
jgi:uncharacterized protein